MLENEPELEKHESTEDTPKECEIADETKLTAHEVTDDTWPDVFLDICFAFNTVIFAFSILLLLYITKYIIGSARLTILGITVTVLVDFAALVFMMVIPNRLINSMCHKNPERKANALFVYAMTLAALFLITINGGFALTY